MIKKILPALISALLLFASCVDYDYLVPEEYDKILLLMETGEKSVSLYTTGEDALYELTILKGGANPETSASASLEVMSAAELANYSEMYGVLYTALPSNTFEIRDGSANFTGSSNAYHKSSVLFKTTAIMKLMEENPDANYVAPIVLTSANDSINSEKRVLLLKPQLLVPVISFEWEGHIVGLEAGDGSFDVRLKLPFDSPWDFDATIGVDHSEQIFGSKVMPKGSYTIANDGKVIFKKGSNLSEPINITLDLESNLPVGAGYYLPVVITNTSIEGIQTPSESFKVKVETEFNRIPLTSDMLFTNAQEQHEGPIAYLIDGDPNTYFHSSWSTSIDQPHVVMVDFRKKVTQISFSYQNRNNLNGKPQDIIVWGITEDGQVELGRLDEGLPVAGGSIFHAPLFTTTKPITGIVLQVMRTNTGVAPTFFNMAELMLYGK